MFFDPFVAMEYIYNTHLKMPGDPAFADLDTDTKSVLLDLVIYSDEAQQVAKVTIDPAHFTSH
ncbi:hypothetical protein [Nocardia sp. 348MFTsu5.1]|uniref:hypothetical protein n=1 Tax=Nocardia sp. 348MFTsu5.1 TaxID=1172185 RepID=UPI0003629DAE|nr:hypothetical protein [Nocardia sp. 348MFTsu5.1]